ncbi:MCE family protein [Streptomyces sp. B1866]|uniref:MCE family protein n=1 Tax=Streptomyces sp. B1866 TaxID=3075431 RepID=UPI00288DE532|nr:MCE family protein [Streptomyces sp. B1866]MDT3397040.1 MCE family protein [Streptomyces sp. B1866]
MRERNPVTVGFVGLLVMAIVGLLAYNVDGLPVIGGGTTYTAEFSEAAGISPGNEVRVAGVRVGKVKSVTLDGDRVKVTFQVKDTWVGDASRVGISLKTLLGAKYLALEPLGSQKQDPGSRIPLSRTTSPYDVMDAFNDLGETSQRIDSDKLAKSFETISDTFKNTAPEVSGAVKGLSALSRTLSTRDDELADLLRGSNKVTKTLSEQNARFENLLTQGNLLLGEIQARRDAIHALFTGTSDLSRNLNAVVDDNTRQLKPTLEALNRVTDVLDRNRRSLDQALAAIGPYYRLLGNTLGSGRWMDTYLCGLVPKSYLPPGTPPATGCMPPKQGGSR